MEGKMLVVPNLRVVEPNNIFRKVPTRRPNAQMRTREYLTPDEVEKLIAAAKLGRHGHRDATLILVAFRHGLRAVEVADLEWSQVEHSAFVSALSEKCCLARPPAGSAPQAFSPPSWWRLTDECTFFGKSYWGKFGVSQRAAGPEHRARGQP
jgi:hypothetical protein